MQRQGRHGAPPPCVYFLRGSCRYGTACRFSHESVEATCAALPFHLRHIVQSQANTAIAAASPAAPWRIRVMSYNVLADCLAHEHAAELYSSAPRFALEWGWRSGLILREIVHYQPDVVCLQEVDHFDEFRQALQPHGYEGVYTKRTGERRDGLAMFWRTDAVRPVKQRYIHFNQLGMKDNVAQLLVFQQRSSHSEGSGGGGAGGGASRTSSEGSAGSLSGQKRQQAEPGSGGGGDTRNRHLRFDSSSDGEGDSEPTRASSSAKRRGGSQSSAATAAAFQAISIDNAEGPARHTSLAGAVEAHSPAGSGPAEDATEPADADAAAAAAAAAEAVELGAAASAPRMPPLVVANIHVLFNPKRGDLKMGQLRTLLEHVDSLCLQQLKLCSQRAAAVICGDFNSAAGSPLYEFVRTGELDLSQHDRRRMSGQVESTGGSWRSLQQAFLARQQQQQQPQASPRLLSGAGSQASWQQQQEEQEGQQLQGSSSSRQLAVADSWPGQPPRLRVDAAAAAVSGYSREQQPPVPPYAPVEPFGTGRSSNSSSRKSMRAWAAEDTCLAAGSSASCIGGVARHPMHIDSSYGAVTGAEAAYSTCHDKFIGCVDYMWFTPSGTVSTSSGSGGGAASWRLLPLGVFEPPPLQTLHCALPSPAWPSDHISLVCDFALLPGAAEPPQPQQQRRARGKGKSQANL